MNDTKPITVPRGPGRPRTVCADRELGSTVTTYLPAAYHDRLVKIAEQRDASVSAVVRQLLILRLPSFSTDK